MSPREGGSLRFHENPGARPNAKAKNCLLLTVDPSVPECHGEFTTANDISPLETEETQ
jgi:hypothetical protein